MGDQQAWAGGEVPLEAVGAPYLAAAHGALLGELRLDPLLVGLSDGYELCRRGGAGRAAAAAALPPTERGCCQLLLPPACRPPVARPPPTCRRLVECDAAALAGRPAKWVPPDRFQRVTRSASWGLLLRAGCGRCR